MGQPKALNFRTELYQAAGCWLLSVVRYRQHLNNIQVVAVHDRTRKILKYQRANIKGRLTLDRPGNSQIRAMVCSKSS